MAPAMQAKQERSPLAPPHSLSQGGKKERAVGYEKLQFFRRYEFHVWLKDARVLNMEKKSPFSTQNLYHICGLTTENK